MLLGSSERIILIFITKPSSFNLRLYILMAQLSHPIASIEIHLARLALENMAAGGAVGGAGFATWFFNKICGPSSKPPSRVWDKGFYGEDRRRVISRT